MDYLSSGNRFAHLSLEDLLRARDQFHAHLVHKRNVIGTAVGRYLIRKGDPWPGQGERPPGPKPPRTLEGSEIRDYSWPCVLVFVDRWVDESQIGSIGELPASDYVPKTIYMEDGKSVPICLVLAPPVMTPPSPRPAPFVDSNRLQGGHAIISETQHVPHRGTIGCLLTDGHKVYALTSRHVAGGAGETLSNGVAKIGVTSPLQLSRVPFEKAYAPWPGKQVFVNLDVALVEVDDLRRWSSGIQSIGAIGPLAALSTQNLSLNLIGCPVSAFGAASGPMEGRIAALFYRYKSLGGFEYVADFLIGSRTARPLPTLPGDSGMVWVMDPSEEGERGRPIAVQWGGAVLGGEAHQTTFALASNLSTVCRELDVDLYRGSSVAAFEYWGPTGHRHIGEFATGLVQSPNLKTLLGRNVESIGAVANYPDNLWKDGSRPDEGINHYADADLSLGGVRSLADQTPNAAALSTATWRAYYSGIKAAGGDLSPGLLPFRAWQIFNELKTIVASGNVLDIVAAMGILAHYLGDSCQTLHSSYLTDGDPFRKSNGSPSGTMIPHGKAKYGKGLHSAYESKMIDANEPDLVKRVTEALPAQHGLPLVSSGREAAWATMTVMNSSRARIRPMELVERYVKAKKDGDDPNDVLWAAYGQSTVEAMVEGCSVLAMLWDSAWREGNGDAIDPGDLIAIDEGDLRARCQGSTSFLESMNLQTIVLDE